VIEDATNTLGCHLAAEVARTFGSVRLRVSGTSMVPAILPGDLLSVERARAAKVSPGEVVVFAQQGRLVAHRVTAKRGTQDEYLITRGDRIRQEDAPVSDAELIGRVTQVERGRSQISAPSRGNIPWQMFCRLLRFSDRATSLYLRLRGLPSTLQ